jgi:hypothetical protein
MKLSSGGAPKALNSRETGIAAAVCCSGWFGG